MEDKLQYIADTLGVEEILIQLGEEASELTQAALKLRRCISGKNPTPKTYAECMNDVIKESADVEVCLEALLKLYPLQGVLEFTTEQERTKKYKVNRWVKRLKEKELEEK